MAHMLGHFYVALACSAAVSLILVSSRREKKLDCYEHYLHLGDRTLKVMLRLPVDMQSKSSEVLALHSYWQHSTASCRLEPGMSIVFNIYIMFLFLLYLDTGFSFPNCSCSQFLEFE